MQSKLYIYCGSFSLQDEHETEFENIEAFDENHIKCSETTLIAKSPLNIRRNRYGDMVPYDSNIVHLQSASGHPSSTYINASWVIVVLSSMCPFKLKF